eukprot:Nitzschia sp. Nitz4//scaffold314_size20990//7142//7879//NITZ4_008629-RA/size20990-processed-gene-0.40-mRNA-1//-1//CDS//3329547464//4558//frame0
MVSQWKFVLFTVALLLCTRETDSKTLQLATCPQEPDVVGVFYNNGKKCVRDRTVVAREVINATCPEEFEYKAGMCRKRLHKSVRPSCPEDYQRFNAQCQSKCKYPYTSRYGECVLSKSTLNARFMICPESQHHFGAYCCTPGVDCPQLECNMGTAIPGKWYFNETSRSCDRAAKSVVRPVTTRKRGEECQAGMVSVWGGCQEPCPGGYKTSKGRCEMHACSFDTRNSGAVVRCPEGTYAVPKSMV